MLHQYERFYETWIEKSLYPSIRSRHHELRRPRAPPINAPRTPRVITVAAVLAAARVTDEFRICSNVLGDCFAAPRGAVAVAGCHCGWSGGALIGAAIGGPTRAASLSRALSRSIA